MNVYFFIILVFVILSFVFVKFKKSTLPIVYELNKSYLRPIVILAGTHGNETGPVYAIDQLITNGQLKTILNGVFAYVVPFINSDAVGQNKRHTWWQPDINRSYPDKNEINRSLLPYINQANLVLDFHESQGLYRCPSRKHLGRLLSTHNHSLFPLLLDVVNKLNNSTPKLN